VVEAVAVAAVSLEVNLAVVDAVAVGPVSVAEVVHLVAVAVEHAMAVAMAVRDVLGLGLARKSGETGGGDDGEKRLHGRGPFGLGAKLVVGFGGDLWSVGRVGRFRWTDT
jgi:hypothetical protein